MAQLRNRINGLVRSSQQVDREIRSMVSCGAVINYDAHGEDVVFDTPRPAYDQITQSVREIAQELTQLGHWEQRWEVVSLDAETIAANQAAAVANLIQSITSATQTRLDTFAHTRNYDGILSAATYATSINQAFAAEGQYAVTARDNTWAALYTIMAEVQAGTRPMPTSFADVEPDLPVLAWPA